MTSLLKTTRLLLQLRFLRQDFDAYKAGKYDYLILDEAQVMKNTQTKIAQYLRDFLFHIA